MSVKPLHPDKVQRATRKVESNIVYQILPAQRQGINVPFQLGQGKFAKVYQAWQRSDGRNIRQVAIKVLHDHAGYAYERLFREEINLLKELSSGSRVNVVSTLDVVHLGPMAMCGCGEIYSPYCPRCGALELVRKDPEGGEYPALACPNSSCGYEITAQHIEMYRQDLLRPPAKACCQSGPKALQGTLINFVSRPAIVMELLECRLDRFAEQRRTYFNQICGQHDAVEVADPARGRRLPLSPRREAEVLKAMTLDKMLVMAQLAETVAWLHGEKGIVHKDLSPDNIMVRFTSHNDEMNWRGPRALGLVDVLSNLASYPSFGVKVIDFGLSDRQELSRKWYEEQDVTAAVIKLPFLSPEARLRKQPVHEAILFEGEENRFQIPGSLKTSRLSVMAGDILADVWDPSHDHDLKIVRVEEDPAAKLHYAYYEGTPPPDGSQRQYELIRPLGEAHDVYALGALFYYILTEKTDLEELGALVTTLDVQPCELVASALVKRDNYTRLRDAIPIPERRWKDELMVLILRAMVRGQPQSFASVRIQRGKEPAQRLLAETLDIYHRLKREVLARPQVSRVQRWAAVATLAALIGGAASGALLGRRSVGSASTRQVSIAR